MTTEDDLSTEISSKSDDNEQVRRQLALLNDGNYGTILCFLDKFRSSLDIPNYSLQRLEDHLLRYNEKIPSRLMDFHFILLKRLSLAKNTQREKFDSIITKFAARFDYNDADHLTATGYLKAEMNVKIRILKNLLESQFDLNQTFRNTFVDKLAREIKSTPLGRDRFGVSYWLFMDTNCFIRLFRENIDIDRSWSNIAKDRYELEKFIKILITDSVVRKKFSDWTIDYEQFSTLEASDEFEQNYFPPPDENIKYEEIESIENENESMKKKRGRPKGSIKLSNNDVNSVKTENKQENEEVESSTTDDEEFDVPVKRKRGRPKTSLVENENDFDEIENETKEEQDEDDEEYDEKHIESAKKKRGRPRSSLNVNSKEEQHVKMEVKTEKDQLLDIKPKVEETSVESLKKKRGRPRGSIVVDKKHTGKIDTEIKQEQEEVEEEVDEKRLNGEEQAIESAKRKRGRPKGSITVEKKETPQMNITIKKEQDADGDKEGEIHKKSNDEDETIEPVKRKRGRPRGSTIGAGREQRPIDIQIKADKNEETEDDEEENIDEEHSNEVAKRKRGRPRGSTKLVAKEKIEYYFKPKCTDESDQKNLNNKDDIESIKRKRGRPKSLIKQTTAELKEEIASPTRRGRKRKTIIDDNTNDENDKPDESSPDDTNSTLRRSTRPRKAATIESTYIVNSNHGSETSNSRKKRSVNGRTKSSHHSSNAGNSKSGRSRRRRKTSRRHINDEFIMSSTSSDEQIDYLSDDDYESDDYLPSASQLEDDNFFEFDDDNNATGEELRTAKTAQASTIITACRVCLKSDRPEVLLLCDDCDDAYHLECLRPRLLSVPDGDWFCPLCEHKKLSNNLIEKLKELLVNYNLVETKRLERESKKSLQRKIKAKEYTSDESITASESEPENLENNLHADETTLSPSQTNENSNVSSSFYDDPNKNISQRGRRRRTRFDMNKMLNNDDDSDKSTETSDDDDDEYVQHAAETANFDLQIPKKMTRLLNQRYRPIARNDQQLKPRPIAPRLPNPSVDLNEKLGSPIIYINGDCNSHQMKSVITNSNQTLKIVRRWNDVQRRNRFRTNNVKLVNETTSDCADENSVFCPDDTSPPRSNESNHNSDTKEEDCTIIRSKITITQSANLLPVYKTTTKSIVKKNDVNFDRLTRDIQYAVSEANTLPSNSRTIDQQQIKRIQKTNFSPYLTKVALRPLPVILPKPPGVGYKIFKSKDPPGSTSKSSDLSNIMLTPSSSSSLLDTNDEQLTSTMNT